MSDEELYERLKQGDGEALSMLYDLYAVRVARIARRWFQDQQTIEEVVQDVFTRIWTTTAFTPEKGKFKNWIGIVARRIAIDHLRKSKRNHDVPESARMDVFSDDNRMEHNLNTTWLRQDLMKAMERLRPDLQIVVQLAYFKGHTLMEIASLLNLPIGTVKTRLHHALKSLKSSMTDWTKEG